MLSPLISASALVYHFTYFVNVSLAARLPKVQSFPFLLSRYAIWRWLRTGRCVFSLLSSGAIPIFALFTFEQIWIWLASLHLSTCKRQRETPAAQIQTHAVFTRSQLVCIAKRPFTSNRPIFSLWLHPCWQIGMIVVRLYFCWGSRVCQCLRIDQNWF